MDIIKKIYKMALVMAIVLTSLSGCVGSNLDDCPPGLNYSLAFQYLIHQKTPADLFTQDVQYISVYVFDANEGNLVYTETTPVQTWEQGSNNDYKMNLPLNAGDYNIITWGWGYETEEYLDSIYERGANVPVERSVPVVTPMTSDTRLNNPDVQLRVNTTENDSVIGRIERTFFGQKLSVNVPPMTSSSPAVIDTVPLLNIANHIRVVITNAKQRFPDFWKDLRVSIVGTNQSYFFNPHEVGRSKRPTYIPPFSDVSSSNAPYFDPDNDQYPVVYKAHNKHLTDLVLIENQIIYDGADLDSVYIADISTMRMIAGDQDLAIRVEWDDEEEGSLPDIKLLNLGGSLEGLIIREFKKYYQNAFFRDPTLEEVQAELDKNFEWTIFIEIPDNLWDNYVSATIVVTDWSSQSKNVEVGSDQGI
jgi:hypothetical protein